MVTRQVDQQEHLGTASQNLESYLTEFMCRKHVTPENAFLIFVKLKFLIIKRGAAN